MEQEQEGRLGRPAVVRAFTLALLALACGRSEDRPADRAAGPGAPALADAAASLRADLERSEARVAELEVELREATAKQIAREEEWLRHARALAELQPALERVEPKIEPEPEAAGAVSDPRAERDHQIHVSLRTLFTLDQVTGFELLESGTFKDGATGPVVLRALDDRGRPVASLAAERLRLEGSRSARTVTLVLEDGFERRGLERTPFEGPMTGEGRGGVRRVELPATDPGPWIEALPELFREEDKAPLDDDGVWDLGGVRATLNLLLREDLSAGWWKLVAFGGVRDGVLKDVQLDGLDADGRLERKLFADRLEISALEKGVKLELRDGAQMRGDEKIPFLEGRYRIFLPRASVEEWSKAGIPGISPAPAPAPR